MYIIAVLFVAALFVWANYENIKVKVQQLKNNFKRNSLEDFQVVEFLGKGANGICLAMKGEDRKVYAIKLAIPAKDEKVRSLMLESRCLASLRHENVVAYHGSWTVLVNSKLRSKLQEFNRTVGSDAKKFQLICYIQNGFLKW